MKYHEQIKHPLWQKKRLEVMEYRNFECENCGNKDNQLNIHHTYYKRGAMVWDYEVDELKCLCERCHKDEHALDEKIKKEIAIAETDLKLMILGFIQGCNSAIPVDIDKSIEAISGYLLYEFYSKNWSMVENKAFRLVEDMKHENPA